MILTQKHRLLQIDRYNKEHTHTVFDEKCIQCCYYRNHKYSTTPLKYFLNLAHRKKQRQRMWRPDISTICVHGSVLLYPRRSLKYWRWLNNRDNGGWGDADRLSFFLTLTSSLFLTRTKEHPLLFSRKGMMAVSTKSALDMFPGEPIYSNVLKVIPRRRHVAAQVAGLKLNYNRSREDGVCWNCRKVWKNSSSWERAKQP